MHYKDSTYCRKSAPHSAHISFIIVLCSQTSSNITACLKHIYLIDCIGIYGIQAGLTNAQVFVAVTSF